MWHKDQVIVYYLFEGGKNKRKSLLVRFACLSANKNTIQFEDEPANGYASVQVCSRATSTVNCVVNEWVGPKCGFIIGRKEKFFCFKFKCRLMFDCSKSDPIWKCHAVSLIKLYILVLVLVRNLLYSLKYAFILYSVLLFSSCAVLSNNTWKLSYFMTTYIIRIGILNDLWVFYSNRCWEMVSKWRRTHQYKIV